MIERYFLTKHLLNPHNRLKATKLKIYEIEVFGEL